MKARLLSCLVVLLTWVASPKASAAEGTAHPLDNWQWRYPLPTGSSLSSVAYGNGSYVAVGQGGAIFRSPDAVQWNRSISGTKESLSKIVFASGLFVAAGRNGTVLHSADGLNWSPSASGSADNFVGLVHGSGLFIAVAPEGSIVRSTDGIHWVSTGVPGVETLQLSDLAYGNGEFLAVGWGGSLRSVDGITWSAESGVGYRVPFAMQSSS